MSAEGFAHRALHWFDRHGRHDLPWQHPRTPYRVWVSEIMLQQTQVATVIPYFERFMARFPDVGSLAVAAVDDVLAQWSGLGYYARGRNLHACAQALMQCHGGVFPQTIDAWMALPGIGRSTAGAIVAQAFDRPAAVLDGNVRRVLARHAGIEGWPGQPAVLTRLWQVAEARLPTARHADYAQAMMDLGHRVCTARRPACGPCPLREDCYALHHDAQGRLPAARPRRSRPRRAAWLAVVRNESGQLWLERRPPRGIWGGLWCPPVLEGAAAYEEWRSTWPGLQMAAGDGTTVHHAFTHFELALTVREGQATGAAPGVDGAWSTIEDALQRGLPAPVRRVLQTLTPELPRVS